MQTLSAIDTHLPPDLAKLAASYICPPDASPDDAAHYGHYEMVATTEDIDLTPRMFGLACTGGHIAIVELLITRGEHHYDSGLAAACRGGHHDIIDRMVSYGATDWNFAYTGARCGGHLDIMERMRKRVTRTYPCPHTDCKAGTLAVIKQGIETGRQQASDHTSFTAACRGGHVDAVEYLLSQGADAIEMGLYAACEGGHMAIMNMLVARGACNWKYALSGACRGGHLAIVQFVAPKVDFASVSLAALQSSCAWGRASVVEYLLDRGADALDELSMHDACEDGNQAVVDLLIRHGNTAWNIGMLGASTGGHLDLVKSMSNRGAANWNECIVGAASTGHVRMVQYLISRGAAATAEAINSAEVNEHYRVARFLREVPV
jgi:hypothetical protein